MGETLLEARGDTVPGDTVAGTETCNATVVRIGVGALWGALLTQTISLPGNIQASLLFLVGAVVAFVLTGHAVFRPLRFIVFLTIVAMLGAGSILAFGGAVSLAALVIGIVLYTAFIFVVPCSAATYAGIARGFLGIVTFIAVIVLAQWLIQFARLPFLHLQNVVPDALFYHGYNYLQPVRWASPLLKPNGIFMLEASHTSQLLAIGIVVEMCLDRRLGRLMLFGAALLSTLAGTGVLILLLTAPFLLPQVPRRFIAPAAIAGVLVLAIAYGSGIVSYFTSRLVEFGQEGSSGNGRFIEPYQFMIDVALRDLRDLFAGVGIGNAKHLQGRSQTIVLTPLAKTIIEVGVPTAIAWMAYFHVAMFRSVAPLPIIVALILQFDLMNGSLIVPIHVAYCYLLAGAYVAYRPRLTGPSFLPQRHSGFSPAPAPSYAT